MAGNERSPKEQMFDRAIRSLMESAVDSLPEDYRTVVMLRNIEGLSLSETAECLDLGQDSIETRLFRARAMLSKRLFDRLIRGAPEAFQFLDTHCDRVVKNVLNRIRR